MLPGKAETLPFSGLEPRRMSPQIQLCLKESTFNISVNKLTNYLFWIKSIKLDLLSLATERVLRDMGVL